VVQVSGFACTNPVDNPFWQAAGYTCFAGAHLVLSVIAGFMVALFAAICILFALLFFDSHPLSSDWGAKAHGRADFAMLISETLLTILVDTFPNSISDTGNAAVVAVSSVVWAALAIHFMPYLRHEMNRINVGCALVYVWLAICLLVVENVPGFDAGIMAYAGILPAFIAGAWVADQRAMRIHRCPIARLDNGYEVELKVSGTATAERCASDRCRPRARPAYLPPPPMPPRAGALHAARVAIRPSNRRDSPASASESGHSPYTCCG